MSVDPRFCGSVAFDGKMTHFCRPPVTECKTFSSRSKNQYMAPEIARARAGLHVREPYAVCAWDAAFAPAAIRIEEPQSFTQVAKVNMSVRAT